MEMEVRLVGGIQECYVALPLTVLQTLESTLPGQRLPAFLPLQLLSPTSPEVIAHVAWSGSASSSSSLEIAHEFGACIGLSHGSLVRVRPLPNLPKATLVTIHPLTEDDWEVVHLNAHLAEDAFLNQVRVVYANMSFPLWLHGNRVVTFTVVSMLPDKTAVQLVPGTEVAVAPKRRTKSADHLNDSSLEPSKEAHCFQKVLLRVQDSQTRLTHESDLGGATVGVELTSIALVHPDTAKEYMFNSLQVVVILPRLSLKTIDSSQNKLLKKPMSSSAKDLSKALTNKERDNPYAIVRLVISESAAKGHLMLCRSLRRYLRVSFHSWVYVQMYFDNRKNEAPSYFLSSCQFKILHKTKDSGSNSKDMVDDSINLEDKLSTLQLIHDTGEMNLSLREKLISSLLNGTTDTADEETGISANIKDRLKRLIHTWIMAQSQAISLMTGVMPTSLVFGPTTFLNFKLMASGCVPDSELTIAKTETSGDARVTVEPVNEILYMLAASGESLHSKKYSSYELDIGQNQLMGAHDDLKLFCENLTLGTYVSYDTCNDHVVNQTCVSSLSWMGTALTDVINRLTSLLSPDCGALPLPGHVLIHGPPGSGKTLLASAASRYLEGNKDILAHTVFIGCSAFSMEKASIRQVLCDHLSEALDNAPSIIVLDDLDSIVTSGSDTEGSQMSASVVALAKFIAEIIDEYGEKRKKSCGLGPIAFIACVRAVDRIPESLTASGRFNFHIQLPAPSTSERLAILRHEIQKHSLQCSDDVLLDIATKCDGFDAYDLGILVGRTIHAAISRFLPFHGSTEDQVRPSIIAEDFLQAKQDFLPVSMRDITNAAPDGSRIGWEDVGGLIDVRNAIKEMIEMPSRFPNIFAQSPLRLRSNVLLYGPPGCGKTHIVGAAAAASSLRFISIKGPELLNKYIGASEQAVRDVFSRAAAAAPCILFFDEFDSIAPQRGHDNTGVTDRVVNQFLTELDGVEVLTGVFVFAATSRPDLLDAALLRPGRLDRLLFCDFPDKQDRLDILRVLSKKLPMSDDVDLEAIAITTDGFSGADLQALLSDAQLAAAQEILDRGYDGKQEISTIITGDLLNSAASKAKPSVSVSEQQRLYAIYNQFVDSKRSVAAQSRDAKGKRATLA
ncbi:hypothetical protein vseg_014099 [Gypsophila vaccaria]